MEAAVPGEGGAGEEQEERHLAVLERVEVPCRGDVQVVGAGHDEVHLGLGREGRDHEGDLGELHGLQRVSPARAVTEEVVQSVRLGLLVAAPAGFDTDLAAQREGMHPGFRRRGDAQPEDQRGAGRVRVGADSGAGEGKFRHRGCSFSWVRAARPSTCAKNALRSALASAPPSKPCQRRRMRPTSS